MKNNKHDIKNLIAIIKAKGRCSDVDTVYCEECPVNIKVPKKSYVCKGCNPTINDPSNEKIFHRAIEVCSYCMTEEDVFDLLL